MPRSVVVVSDITIVKVLDDGLVPHIWEKEDVDEYAEEGSSASAFPAMSVCFAFFVPLFLFFFHSPTLFSLPVAEI